MLAMLSIEGAGLDCSIQPAARTVMVMSDEALADKSMEQTMVG